MPRLFDDWLDTYMQHTDNSEPAALYRRWVGISTIASVLKRKAFVDIWTRIYPNLYIVLVGPPGGRKGHSMNQALPMLEILNIKLAAEALTREALIKEMSKSTDSYMTEDGKTYQHCSLTIHAQELAVFLGQGNLQLLSDLTDWFDCKRIWTYRTKNMGTDVIEGVWVNLLGATTPGILQNSLPQDAIGGGLTSRILFIYAPGKGKVVPMEMKTTADFEQEIKLTQDLEDISLMTGPFKLEEAFVDYYCDWYVRHESRPPFSDHKFAGYNERKALHAIKVAMVLSASRSSEMVITVSDFERALEYLSEAEHVMPRVFDGYGRREHADLIPQIMNCICGNKTVSRRELLGRFMADMTFQQLDEIIASLCEVNFCTRSIDPKGAVLIHFKGEHNL